MAITMIKEPDGIYPAYNDSFLEFTSDLVGHNKAEVTIYPSSIFPEVFLIYPDADGNYLFNLKEVVKTRLNELGFEDKNFDDTQYWFSISGLYLLQQLSIKVLSDSDQQIRLGSYQFFKAIKQVGEAIYNNTFQLLTYTDDGYNHYLTYFEGFPFHFDIQRVEDESNITVYNRNTGAETSSMVSTEEGSFRVGIDRGGANNWTSDNVLPLIEGLNNLGVKIGGEFGANLMLTKKKKCSGVYLKWFNRSGGYSHYLFDTYYIDRRTSSEIGRVFNNTFENVGDTIGAVNSLGKEAIDTIIVKTKYPAQDYEVLKDIFTSPQVQLYTSRTAYVQGYFINVFVDGSISFSNKRGLNDISITIELQEVVTAKY